MELQATLVNSRIDDLRQTAHEVHAGSAARTTSSESPISAVRRGLGVRLIALGLALALPAMRSNGPTSARMA